MVRGARAAALCVAAAAAARWCAFVLAPLPVGEPARPLDDAFACSASLGLVAKADEPRSEAALAALDAEDAAWENSDEEDDDAAPQIDDDGSDDDAPDEAANAPRAVDEDGATAAGVEGEGEGEHRGWASS